MSVTLEPETAALPPAEPSPGLWRRAALIFTRPARAWSGLESGARWWFPMLVLAVMSSVTLLVVYERSYLPMMTEGIERQVAEGQMSQQQLERTEAFFSGPIGKSINIGFQFLGVLLVTFFTGLVVWLGGAFILGRPFGYRLALEVAAWSGLITLPGFLLTSVIAYLQGVTVREVHVGFGILVPDPDTPSRLITGLRAFLDGLGPLSVWYVVVAILGLSALSGTPRRAAAWVMGSLYLILVLLGAVIASLSTHAG